MVMISTEMVVEGKPQHEHTSAGSVAKGRKRGAATSAQAAQLRFLSLVILISWHRPNQSSGSRRAVARVIFLPHFWVLCYQRCIVIKPPFCWVHLVCFRDLESEQALAFEARTRV